MRWLSIAVVLLGCGSSATPDAAVTDAPAGPTLRQPPTRPSGEDEPDGPVVVLALRDAFLDQGSDWAGTGLDLDGVHTAPGSSAGECPSTCSDGEEGIDNVVGESLYPLLEAASPGLGAAVDDALENGRGNLVVEVRGWDGTADDPRVDASVVRAMVITSAGDAAPPALLFPAAGVATLADGSAVPPPAWDGGDWAWARSDGLIGGDPASPLVRDEDAYVAGGVLVMRLPERAELVLDVLALRLSGAVLLVGPLGAADASVTLAGRWAAADLLEAASRIGVCPGSAQAGVLGAQLERVADLRAAPGTTGPCDALSVGLGFTARAVRWAGVADGAPSSSACP